MEIAALWFVATAVCWLTPPMPKTMYMSLPLSPLVLAVLSIDQKSTFGMLSKPGLPNAGKGKMMPRLRIL